MAVRKEEVHHDNRGNLDSVVNVPTPFSKLKRRQKGKKKDQKWDDLGKQSFASMAFGSAGKSPLFKHLHEMEQPPTIDATLPFTQRDDDDQSMQRTDENVWVDDEKERDGDTGYAIHTQMGGSTSSRGPTHHDGEMPKEIPKGEKHDMIETSGLYKVN